MRKFLLTLACGIFLATGIAQAQIAIASPLRLRGAKLFPCARATTVTGFGVADTTAGMEAAMSGFRAAT